MKRWQLLVNRWVWIYSNYEKFEKEGTINADKKVMKKYYSWLRDSYLKISDLYLNGGIEENAEKIDYLQNFILLVDQEIFMPYKGGSFYKTHKERFDKHFDIESLPFSLEYFNDLAMKRANNRTEYDKVMVKGWRQNLLYYMDIVESKSANLVNKFKNPYTLLRQDLATNNIKYFLRFLLLLLPIILITIQKKEKSFDLQMLNLKNRNSIFRNYIKDIFFINILTFYLTDFLAFIFLGFKYGFEGYNFPIKIFKPTLSTFRTYKNTGISSGNYSVMREIITKLHNGGEFVEFKDGLESISLNKFLGYSFIANFFIILFITIVAVGMALSIKDILKLKIVAIFMSVFMILSQFIDQFKFTLNPFSYRNGWDITLGWTHVSWLMAIIVLLVSSALCYIVFLMLFKKRN
ncbi:MAG: hypothetical protein Q4B23_05965 [Helcococcus sp.]|nr:hypothetical protein [Helcococcus sp.]